MSTGAIQFAGTLATAVLALVGIWLSTRQTGKKTKTDAAQSLLNELQEERNELKAERTQLRAEVDALRQELVEARAKFEQDMRAAYMREVTRDDFIQELRNHIRYEKGPPPPEWPEGLRRA